MSDSAADTVLVTGGAGFIGSHLVTALVEAGRTVRVIDNLSTGHRINLIALRGKYELIEADLANFDACRRAVEGVSTVFHLAAIPSVPLSMLEPLRSFTSGPLATQNLLEASRLAGVRRVVFSASSSAYGETEELPKHEAMMPRPLSPYAVGKVTGEYLVRVYAQSMGLDGVSLRYFNIFGPRQDPSSPYSGVISLFAKAIMHGVRPTIYGDGQQTRDFTYVANAVKANLLAMEAPGPLGGEVYNVGTGRQISLVDLINAINHLLHTDIQPIFAPPRAGDVRHSLASLDRARAGLGYEPSIDFEAGLKRTVNWFRSAGEVIS
ncbi:SDR family oxidoreductase [Isosphaeraceae bacterium EP7]